MRYVWDNLYVITYAVSMCIAAVCALQGDKLAAIESGVCACAAMLAAIHHRLGERT